MPRKFAHPLKAQKKPAFAAALVTGILTFGAHQFYPEKPVAELAVLAATVFLGFMAVAVGGALLHLAFYHDLLRKGAVDTQWAYTPDDPPGLKQMRGQ